MSKFQNYARKTQDLSLAVYKKSIRGLTHNLLYPCQLGIIFFDGESHSLFEKLKIEINTIFDSYFSKIKKNIMQNPFSIEKRVISRKISKQVLLYPTNQFYEKISELKVRAAFEIGVGITDLPIYSSSANNLVFLYGEAHLNHNCAIVSNYNLKYELNSSSNTLQRRVIKEVIHEVGHIILGPSHCRNKLCVMTFSKSVADIDKKDSDFCKECKCKLEETIEILN
ncbi:MAG: hypothetical protein ACFFFB_21850 [Candidatus Heimdallarchaeota archaeon]